ncbi:MAG TPA: HipA domain-containing protein, partial [Candidatus Methylacidiphilales bacterium]
WDSTIGAVALAGGTDVAEFEYDSAFAQSGIQVAPLMMPLANRVYSFPALSRASFHGLPGMLADALPDKFGNALINAWLATQGRAPDSFNAVERLCYTGNRGMGALEFRPVVGPRPRVSQRLDVDALVRLASEVLSHREDLQVHFHAPKQAEALKDILRIGTSAGGARAKAIIAWNPATNEVRSGQVRAPAGFGYWLLKFDGVNNNKDKELADPEGYGVIEYTYSRMARDAGIVMAECRLLEENGRRHFMTKRFDRLADGSKLHMQSLGAIAHLDFNMAGVHSYEEALLTIRRLGLSHDAVEQQFRRMVFNIVARNQDDHVKNIAFLMDKSGQWALSPAFDVSYSYQPTGQGTANHQMSLNAKRDDFTREDFRTCANLASLPRGRSDDILEGVREVVARWPQYAKDVGVPSDDVRRIEKTLRLDSFR